jgi:cell division protein FtsN
MKLLVSIALAGLLLASCGKKEEPKPVVAKPAPEKKAQPTVPQGKLPVMDPEKAKFIAVPSTPKDPEVKKAEKPTLETKK